MAAAVTGVVPRSPAFRAGIKSGDVLVSVNGHEINDVLDYMFYCAEDRLALVLERDGESFEKVVIKSEYDELGLEFQSFLMDSKRSCSNKCIFCFIDQMPKGMRETLYFKDDDARLSFLQGNYVTLTNLTDRDIDRICEMRLNINVSVHTTEPELRCMMMNNRFAGDKLRYLKRIADSGLMMNCQIVCCPGINDGAHLERSLSDLFRRYENLKGVLEGFKKVPVLCLLSPQWRVFLLMGRQTHVPKVWVAQKRNQGPWAACLNPSSSQSGQQALDMTKVRHGV